MEGDPMNVAIALGIRIAEKSIIGKRVLTFSSKPTWINLEDEPDHQELCNREQRYFLQSIVENLDLTDHAEDAVNSLRIAFACDESVKTGQGISL
jgi:hypothetical protein